MTITKQSDDAFLNELENADTPDYGHSFRVEEILDGADKIAVCTRCEQAYDSASDYRRKGKYCPA